jgi:hypothetical protein
MKHYIGLDAAMKRTFICILDENGKLIYEGSEKNTPAFTGRLYFEKHNEALVEIEKLADASSKNSKRIR